MRLFTLVIFFTRFFPFLFPLPLFFHQAFNDIKMRPQILPWCPLILLSPFFPLLPPPFVPSSPGTPSVIIFPTPLSESALVAGRQSPICVHPVVSFLVGFLCGACVSYAKPSLPLGVFLPAFGFVLGVDDLPVALLFSPFFPHLDPAQRPGLFLRFFVLFCVRPSYFSLFS